MKELSIEEKAKAYDEAIERANELNYVSDKDSLQRKTVEHIFPELAESEDEKIRKELIEFFKWNAQMLNNFDNKEVLAWLEKQGEQKSVEWSEEDERMYRGLHNLIYSTPYCDSRKEFSDWIKSLKDRVVPQPKQEQKPYGQRQECVDCQFNYAGECKGSCAMKRGEQKPWSEEDDQYLLVCKNVLAKYQVSDKFSQWLEDKLKSIKDRVQPKREWSEEDERNLDWLITVCERIHYKSDPQVSPKGALILRDWLKSLKERYTWKPSEEQMKCLSDVIGTDDHTGYVLNTLYNDLKDLKKQ